MSRRQPEVILPDRLSLQIYQVIRHKIVYGELRQGQRLSLPDLAQEFGTSRMPLREALMRLENDRLVVSKPRSGTYVAEITIQDIEEICGIRKAIEWFATAEATKRMPRTVMRRLLDEVNAADEAIKEGNYMPFFESDLNLHRSIVEYSGNSRMLNIRDSIEPYVEWLRVAGATSTTNTKGASARHRQILETMIAGDIEGASKLAAIHVDEVCAWTVIDFDKIS
ncbi:GntR family transcriptional regulator [Izhakiella australiensis]|uniref:GntR family transcriptional regulator n=1 Tax=Izhakiella australiensis TaxID=1926881 RepID=UPI00158FF39C|nr:GntR family transcriptional regulator [Izhakiella australiensis]